MNSNKREKNNNEQEYTNKNNNNNNNETNIDLNLENYDFNEMINIFNISNQLNSQDNSTLFNTINEINNNTHNFNTSFIELLRKIFIILNTLIKYKEYIQINDNNYIFNDTIANGLINKIKNIENFQYINQKNLIQLLLTNNNTNNTNNTNTNNTNNNNTNNTTNTTNTNNNTTNSNNKFIDNYDANKFIDNNYQNTYNNPVVSGSINSIKRITKYTNLHISSLFRDNYYTSSSTNFKYSLPKIFNNVVSLRLSSIEIRKTWFNINKNNNYFTIIDDNNNKIKVTLNIDNIVDITTLQNEINIQLQSNYNNLNINFIEKENNLYKTQITINDNNIKKIIFYEDNNNNNNFVNTLGWILGFRTATYNNITESLTSETFYNNNVNDIIYISINDFQYNYNETNIICFDKTLLDDHIISKLSLSDEDNNIYLNSKNNLLNKRNYNGPINLSKIEVKIYDKFGNILDNNNYDYNFSIELEILYENNNIKSLN